MITEKTKILIVADSPVLPSSGAETIRTIFEPLASRFPNQYELHQIGLSHCFAVTRPMWPVYPTKTGKGRDGKLRFTADDLNGEATLRETVPRIRPHIVFAVNNARSLSALCSSRVEREWEAPWEAMAAHLFSSTLWKFKPSDGTKSFSICA